MDVKNWKWFRYDEIFDIKTYREGENVQNSEIGNTPYVGASCTNNGVTNYVKVEKFITGNKITVARNGSVGSAFYQSGNFMVSPDDIRIFELKNRKLNKYIAIFLCCIIEKEKYRYAYGRKFGTKRMCAQLMKLPVVKNEIGKYEPNWGWIEEYVKLAEKKLPTRAKDVWQNKFNPKPISETKIKLNTSNWKWFRYDEIFKICKGFYNKKPEENPVGAIPFIGATDSNNGITSMHDLETIKDSSKTGDEPNAPLEQKIFKPNCITVSNNGSVGYAFYQPKEFTCTHDVNPLYIHKKWNKELNIFIAMFLCSLIEKERFRWDYGRKWRPKRMPGSLIKLPVRKIAPNEYEPDWQFMEDYIKSLPYSSCL